MKKRLANRSGRVGKNRYEKAAYRDFLTSNKFSLDKTEADPIDTSKTNESSFEDEGNHVNGVRGKSNFLMVKDFFRDKGLMVGIALIIITGYIALNREQGIQGNQIGEIAKDINEIETENKEERNAFDDLKNKFGIFSAETAKDIEYMKKKVGL
ncbi:hypothetical protein ACFL2R_03720 [Patescibacteria group bacterium]